MANISLENLARYDGKIKQYTEDKYLSKNTANWQKTEKAGAVTCYPVPDTELEPIVDFSFEEVPPANGEKSPSNPSTITGISSITITRCETTGVDETQYTVNLDSTYYGGSVNLATGLITVTWAGEALSSFTAVTVNSNTITCNAIMSFRHKGNIVATNFSSNRFVSISNTNDVEHCRQTGDTSTGSVTVAFYIAKTRLDVSSAVDPNSPTDEEWLAAANAWLVENPVFFVGRLFSPYTVQLTPVQIKSLSALDKNTPRLNTLYTNADSIQVGYQKHPARTSYELENAILALGGNE